MLKECPPVVIIEFDTDITLAALHTLVVIKQKYHPRGNNSETHPSIVGEQGEGSMFCFKGWSLVQQQAIDLLEDYITSH